MKDADRISTRIPLSRNVTIFALVFWAIASLFFTYRLAGYGHDVVMAFVAERWPSTAGTITVSGASGARREHCPMVVYEYSVDGQVYRGRRVAFGDRGCGSREGALAVAERFPEGMTVAVRYPPECPACSVIMVGQVLGDTWWDIAFWSFCLWVGAFSLLDISRNFRRMRATQSDGGRV